MTVAETPASFPSATPTGWLPPTATRRLRTGTPPSPHGWREPDFPVEPVASGASSATSLRLTGACAGSLRRRSVLGPCPVDCGLDLGLVLRLPGLLVDLLGDGDCGRAS